MAELPRRVAVSGGAGFIGSHTVEALVAGGASVLVIDDFSHPCGADPPAGVVVLRADVNSKEAEAALADFRPEAVLHLATKGGVVRSLRDPAAHVQVSLVNSVAFFNSAIKAGAKAIVAASSGGTIYGAAERLPSDERLPMAPVSPYGASKAAEEIYLAAFGRLHQVRTLSVRYGNVYGPRQDGTGEAGLVAITCTRLIRHEQPVIYGDGDQTRDFVFVTDIARGNAAGLASERSGAVNFGTGRQTSVNQIVATLTELAGEQLEPEREPARPGELRDVALEAHRAETWFGWRPQVEVRDGLARTLDYFRQLAGEPVTA